jgi:hypothetical protein
MTISDTYFQAFYDELTEGQKQHMTNKIYKETGMYPQKLYNTKQPEVYASGTRFIHRQTGRTYILSSVVVGNDIYWVAVNADNGLAYNSAKKLGFVNDNNLAEILVHPDQFKVEK